MRGEGVRREEGGRETGEGGSEGVSEGANTRQNKQHTRRIRDSLSGCITPCTLLLPCCNLLNHNAL